MAASLAYGVGFWLQVLTVPAEGAVAGLARLCDRADRHGVLSLAGIVRLTPPERPLLVLSTLCASLFSMARLLALTEGMDTQQVALVVALSSSRAPSPFVSPGSSLRPG